MPRLARRPTVLILVLLTLAVLAVDRVHHGDPGGSVAAEPGISQLRSAGATLFGPLERLVTPGPSVHTLLAAPGLTGARVLPARVVGVGRQGAGGPERVTLDVGSRDGVRTNQCVVNAQGLVGRVVSVGPWTADVALVGSADVVAGVRVGPAGTLGSVASGASGAIRRTAGLVNLTLVQRGAVQAGDAVTTLGSVGGSPYPPGLAVGTVTSVDTGPGDLAPTAAVRPAVDVTTLDVVGVLLLPPRTSPRPAVTAGG